ncbi:hypothetical protein HpM116_09010 [Helicobacter pylori]
MNTNKNKNASHLTHEMKNEHGGLAEASKKANEQTHFRGYDKRSSSTRSSKR